MLIVMLGMSFEDLLAYTDWQRGKWHAFFRANADALTLSIGDHGDGRFTTLGDVVKHIFGAELRYVQRLEGEALSDFATIPSDQVEALFNQGV